MLYSSSKRMMMIVAYLMKTDIMKAAHKTTWLPAARLRRHLSYCPSLSGSVPESRPISPWYATFLSPESACPRPAPPRQPPGNIWPLAAKDGLKVALDALGYVGTAYCALLQFFGAVPARARMSAGCENALHVALPANLTLQSVSELLLQN